MKKYLIVSFVGYPFGGGEQFLYQTSIWAKNLNYECYWLSFSGPSHNIYSEFKIINHNLITMINVPGGLNETNLYNWIKLIKPNVVHHQGHYRKLFIHVCDKLRIPILTGFHFWHDAIILNEEKLNIDMLENYKYHKKDPNLDIIVNNKYTYVYVVSEFMRDVIQKITNYDLNLIISATSSKDNCLSISNKIRKYVTIINIHILKGGSIFLNLIKKYINIPFLAIRTEPDDSKIDIEIQQILSSRKHCMFIERTENIKDIYAETKILLVPSLVDETYCRVVSEAYINSIPIITTGQGNIKYLVNDSSPIVDKNDMSGWEKELYKLYYNGSYYNTIVKKVKLRYEKISENKQIQVFNDVINDIYLKSKSMNIMILTPWCDQGLGIQSRNYKDILIDTFNVFIFAIKPYNYDSCILAQKNPKEWEHNNIYYSPNDREHITNTEIIKFIRDYNIGKCIIPETCWFRIFEIAKLLREYNVQCYAIPNIEIVRKDEIFKHRFFTKILCNNYICQKIFSSFNINNCYIGYGIKDIIFKPTPTDTTIKYLFLGGLNAFTRKQCLEILEAFNISTQTNKNIELTCCIQSFTDSTLDKYIDNKQIIIIQEHLPYETIINMYYSHHITIQVSKHEGLGLGFYESILTGTPVLTLDTAPHNEIINGTNGWYIKCFYKKMMDNTNSFLESAYFDPVILSNQISKISNIDINNMYNTMKGDIDTRLNFDNFKLRFIESITH